MTADQFGEPGFIAVVLCGARILRKREDLFDSILEKAWRGDESLNKYADESLTELALVKGGHVVRKNVAWLRKHEQAAAHK